MAAYDLEAQDKLADLKTWWSRFGNLISIAVVVVCLIIIGAQAWRWYNRAQAEKAALLYQVISDVVSGKDVAQELPKAKDAAQKLLDGYAGTGYAPRGALVLAKGLFDAGDLDGAASQLAWVASNAKEDEIKQIGRMRHAAVLLDQQKYDAALATLDGKFGAALEGVVLDMKGDVFFAAKRNEDAKTAYTAALAKLEAKSPLRGWTETKLAALGATVPAVKAP